MSMISEIADKLRSLKTLVGSIEKQFGKGAIMALGVVLEGLVVVVELHKEVQLSVIAY
jgi:NAD(P)H-nitrite reductase large subunit